jgi:hypothetical protein
MMWLRLGDRLPSVALVQQILHHCPGVVAPPEVDGVFGPRTRHAVCLFQGKNGLKPDGIVGPKTWAKLRKYGRYSIIDVVDTTDPKSKQAYDNLKKLGSDPITFGFRTNALSQLGEEVPKRSKKEGPIALLRIIGHGKAGQQNLSSGLGGHWIKDNPQCVGGELITVRDQPGCRYPASEGSALALQNFHMIELYLRTWKACFAPLGSIELHGCNVAALDKGEMFLFRLALFLEVPVSASPGKSVVSETRSDVTLRYESPPTTWFPWAGEMKEWAQAQAQEAEELRQKQPA